MGDDVGSGIAENRISQDVIMVSMCIDQIKLFFDVLDLIADIPILMRRTAAINRNGMNNGIQLF